jgi:hypothetical protein
MISRDRDVSSPKWGEASPRQSWRPFLFSRHATSDRARRSVRAWEYLPRLMRSRPTNFSRRRRNQDAEACDDTGRHERSERCLRVQSPCARSRIMNPPPFGGCGQSTSPGRLRRPTAALSSGVRSRIVRLPQLGGASHSPLPSRRHRDRARLRHWSITQHDVPEATPRPFRVL